MSDFSYESMNLVSFAKRFSDEKACEEHLFKIRWPKGFECPRCRNSMFFNLPKRRLYQCKKCGYQASLTSGTVMHKTRTPLLKWFWTIFLVGSDKRGISALALSKKVEISHWKAWTMLGKIRNAMKQRDANYQLAGLVQVDDSYFGGKPRDGNGTNGRGTDKLPVLVEVSTTGDGKPLFAKMQVVKAVSGKEIVRVVSTDIAPGQIIKTDGWLAYRAVKDAGYNHKPTVIYGPKGEGHSVFKWANVIISNVKAFLKGTYHGVSKNGKHLQMYLDEFCYRFNRRKKEPQLFERLLTACTVMKGKTFSELTQ